MRNFLTPSDIARLTNYSRAQVWNWWKAGLIPARNVNARGKHIRFIDSPELTMWCEIKRRRDDYWIIELIQAIVACVMLRDRGADAPKRGDVVAEIFRQLLDSKKPDQLFKKWTRALRDQRFDDLPHVP